MAIGLRQVAFDERRKIHDLLIEGVELALKKRDAKLPELLCSSSDAAASDAP